MDLLNEIWGCVKYIKLPYDTVMNMPVNARKQWIQKYNAEMEEIEQMRNNQPKNGHSVVSGSMLNSYAKQDMKTSR